MPFFLCLVLFLSVAVRAVMSGGGFVINMGKILGIGQQVKMGDTIISQTVGESVGGVTLSGGDYTINPPTNPGTVTLDNALNAAHCYPNPFKPSLGQTQITFSRLTAHPGRLSPAAPGLLPSGLRARDKRRFLSQDRGRSQKHGHGRDRGHFG